MRRTTDQPPMPPLGQIRKCWLSVAECVLAQQTDIHGAARHVSLVPLPHSCTAANSVFTGSPRRCELGETEPQGVKPKHQKTTAIR
jgi:hypothetical protein